MKISFLILSIILLFEFFGLSYAETPASHSYVIKKGDILNIAVWRHEDLTKTVQVDNDGNISFPLIGAIKAGGVPLTALEGKITYLLDKDYIVEPHVSISVEEKKFFVYGEVEKPGSYVLDGQFDPIRAIAVAGGFTDFASRKVRIVREIAGKKEIYRINVNKYLSKDSNDKPIYLQPDDIVIAERRLF